MNEPPRNRVSRQAGTGQDNEANATLGETFIAAWTDFRRAFVDLLIFDLLFRSLAFLVAAPLGAWLLRRLVETRGVSAVGNTEIAWFLLTPVGLIGTAALVVLLLGFVFVRIAGFIVIGTAAAGHRRLGPVAALKFLLPRFPRTLGASAAVLGVLVVALTPFVLLILATVWLLLSAHDINYYLERQPPEFWIALAIGGVLAVAAAVTAVVTSVPMLLAVPESLFRQASPRRLVAECRALNRGQLAAAAKLLGLWFAGVLFLSALANGLIHALGEQLVPLAERGGLNSLLITLGAFTGTSLVTNYLIDFFGIAALSLLIARLYQQACVRSDRPRPELARDTGPVRDKLPWGATRLAPLGAACVVALVGSVAAHEIVDDLRFRDSAEITAHRGSSLKAPENTLAAVRQAISDGATHVEVDVQRTADGRIVINHDADLMRVAGVPLVISKSNFADLRSIELGNDHGDAFPGQRIPTLEEVLEATGERATLIVELKSYRADSSQLIADVVRILREHRDRADAVIMSLNHAEVREVKRIAPEIEAGFVASATIGDITRLEADFLAVSKRQATAVFVGAAHAEEKEVYVWTVDDPKEMSRMVDRGADNLITNDPATAVRVLEMRSELDNTERMLLRFRSLYVD